MSSDRNVVTRLFFIGFASFVLPETFSSISKPTRVQNLSLSPDLNQGIMLPSK